MAFADLLGTIKNLQAFNNLQYSFIIIVLLLMIILSLALLMMHRQCKHQAADFSADRQEEREGRT